uniref:Uncharacterized protein n=1 Tax=Solanum lycopersicum TaxID=4081 RepID=A0A3Q7J765_SOLLC
MEYTWHTQLGIFKHREVLCMCQLGHVDDVIDSGCNTNFLRILSLCPTKFGESLFCQLSLVFLYKNESI